MASERGELRDPIVSGMPDLLVEAPFSARYEQARTVSDVLLRRTRLGLLAAREVCSDQVAGRVASALGSELGWDKARIGAEVARFREEAQAEGIALEAAG
jgi:glycerol-3-phosphate dehydrogenase